MAERIVLFDLGNVVVDWKPVRLYRQIFPTEEEARRFCDEVCTLAWHVEHDRGVPMAENAARLKAEYPHHAAEIDAWRTRWFDMFDGYVTGTDALIEALDAAGHPLYGLSNMPAEVWPETLERFPVLGRLRDVVVSGEEGVVKPDPAIYEIALKRMGHPDPGDVFFIDDSLKNVEAARALGLDTHHFQGADDLEKALAARGFL
ncbi:HAD-IA family hydrolase [Henriciella aquimarina]|uniref:HAD-IA family hydrolase n=1 Tax=Henriciella aquimarina TaxID=545261 RepID=UPI0009FBAE52|nr:HAD-IA family hydrolase [Henriciella aquimarina]